MKLKKLLIIINMIEKLVIAEKLIGLDIDYCYQEYYSIVRFCIFKSNMEIIQLSINKQKNLYTVFNLITIKHFEFYGAIHAINFIEEIIHDKK